VSATSRVLRPFTLTAALVTAAGLIVGLALAVGGHVGHAAAPNAMIGSPAPPLVGTTLTGSHFSLHPATGQVTVVNIWAAWCAPCRDEIPLLARAAADYRARGVRVVTIDTRDGPVAGRSLLEDADARHLVAVKDPEGRLAVDWGATGVPETVIVDPRGIVRARWVGTVSRSWLDDQVRRWARS
jgi:cytochrome c biogenesis protein CcmG/thiol:disulfide interchange protein DsbE